MILYPFRGMWSSVLVYLDCSGISLLYCFPTRHLLIVFGGLGGLEVSLESDESLAESDPSVLFDHYLNTCPTQGSRTIRTEVNFIVCFLCDRPLTVDFVRKLLPRKHF